MFTKKDNLKNHLGHHKGNKAFTCSVCGHDFVQKGNLLKHFQSIHEIDFDVDEEEFIKNLVQDIGATEEGAKHYSYTQQTKEALRRCCEIKKPSSGSLPSKTSTNIKIFSL